MKKTKDKMPRINNFFFYFTIISCSAIIISSFILNCKFNDCLIGGTELFNIVGVVCQVVTAILCSVISVLQISLSIQNTEVFDGLKPKAIHKLRVDKHFSVRFTVILILILLVTNISAYIFNQFILCFGVSLSVVIIGIFVLYKEIPFMVMDDTTIQKVLKERIIEDIKQNKDSNINTIMPYIIWNRNLSEVFMQYKVNEYPSYNKKLLLKLLDFQQDIAFNLDNITDTKQFVAVTKNLIHSISDILYGYFDLASLLEDEMIKNNYYITRVLFQLLKNEKSQKETAEMLSTLTIFYNKNNARQTEFNTSVILTLVSCTVSHNNFILLQELKKQYSLHFLSFNGNSFSTNIFAIVSLYFYYMVECEQDTPDDIKNNLLVFIKYSGVADNTKIISWFDLFNHFLEAFSVNYHIFIKSFEKNWNNLEFMLYSGTMHSVTLNSELALEFYLTCLFNSYSFYDFDYEKKLYDKNNYLLDQIKDQCYKDKEFKPSDRMMKIANFYCNQKKIFEHFLTHESRWHSFGNYLDKLKRTEIEESLQNAQQVCNESFIKKYLPQIENEIKNQWGYKSDLTVKTSDNRQKLRLLIMREASAINYDEALINAFTRQFFYLVGDYVSSKARDIKTNGTNFETEVNDLLNQDIAFATENTTYQTYLIKDEKLQEKYNSKLKDIEIIKSSILYKPTFILKEGFSYNYKILDFSADDLSGDYLKKQVDEYRRPDGQYVYKTVFMSREELCRILHKEYVVIQMDIQYKIDTYPGAIIQFDNI